MRLPIRSRSSGSGFFSSEETGSVTKQVLPSTTSQKMTRYTWYEYMFSNFLSGEKGISDATQACAKRANNHFTGTSISTPGNSPKYAKCIGIGTRVGIPGQP